MALVLYDVGPMSLKWEVELAMERISVLSKEIVRAAVRASSAGLPVNPTANVVEFALLATTGDPAGGDWKAGAWDTSIIGTYVAALVVGPGSTFGALAPGDYYAWLRITDVASGEIVVRQFDKLIAQ